MTTTDTAPEAARDEAAAEAQRAHESARLMVGLSIGHGVKHF